MIGHDVYSRNYYRIRPIEIVGCCNNNLYSKENEYKRNIKSNEGKSFDEILKKCMEK